MGRFQYSHHPFDMNEYLSGDRVVIGGMHCDWDEEETEKEEIIVVKKKPDVTKFSSSEKDKSANKINQK